MKKAITFLQKKKMVKLELIEEEDIESVSKKDNLLIFRKRGKASFLNFRTGNRPKIDS